MNEIARDGLCMIPGSDNQMIPAKVDPNIRPGVVLSADYIQKNYDPNGAYVYYDEAKGCHVATGATSASLQKLAGSGEGEAKPSILPAAGYIPEGFVGHCRTAALSELTDKHRFGIAGQLLIANNPLANAEGSLTAQSKAILKKIGISIPGGGNDFAELSKIFKRLQTAAQKGDARALYQLAIFHAQGWATEQNYEEAVRLLEKAGRQNHADALFCLGYFYDQIMATPEAQSASKGLEYYEKAAALGQEAALFRIGEMAEAKGDFEQALAKYEEAAAKGFPPALSCLASIYLKARRSSIVDAVKPDLTRSVGLLEQAVKLDDPLGKIILAQLCEVGLGTDFDPQRATKLREEALKEVEDSDLAYRVARAYERGEGVDSDLAKAYTYYLQANKDSSDVATERLFQITLASEPLNPWKAAPTGYNYRNLVGTTLGEVQAKAETNPEAMFRLALVLELGEGGVAADPKGAATLYEKAVKMGGHAWAAYRLAQMEEHGIGGNTPDLQKAKEHYAFAAHHKIKGAQYRLAQILENEPNAASQRQAIELYRAASKDILDPRIKESGHLPALASLAAKFQNGRGVERDLPLARKYYEEFARKHQSTYAQSQLQAIGQQ